MDVVDTMGAKQRDRLLRLTAALALAAAASSLTLFALLDASTITSRLSGASIDARPMWLHTFAVAALTCAVAAHALWAQPAEHVATSRTASLIVCALNLTVPILAMSHRDLHLAVSAVHLVIAGLLASVAVLTGLSRPPDG